MQKLLNVRMIADMCGVSRPTLYGVMEEFGRPEPAGDVNGLILYSPDSVVTWLQTVHEGKYAQRFREAQQGN